MTTTSDSLKESIRRVINTPVVIDGHYAPIRIFTPKQLYPVNASAFKKTMNEKLLLFCKKKEHAEALRKAYVADWKKHLNVPANSLSESIRLTF